MADVVSLRPYITAADLIIQLRDDTKVFSFRNTAGSEVFQVDSDGALIVNELGADADTRMEGSGDANLLVLDAGNDRVGIGTATPTLKLDVVGSVGTETGTLVDTSSPSGVLIFRGTTADRRLQVHCSSGGTLFDAFGTAGAVGFTWRVEAGDIVMDLDATGNLQIDGDLIVDGGNVGITADPDLLAMAANVLTVNGGVTLTGDLLVDGTNIGITADADLIAMAANVLTVNGGVTTTGNLLVDGGDIGITAKSDLITLASDAVQIDGELQMQGDSAVRLGQVNTANMNDNIGGGVSNLLYNLNDSTVYVCTGAGAPGSATWVALH